MKDTKAQLSKFNIAHLDGVALEIQVVVGSARMPIEDILKLGHGSIVELDQAAGAPLDILVNGRLLARGEAVVINERLGIRITEIVNQESYQKAG